MSDLDDSDPDVNLGHLRSCNVYHGFSNAISHYLSIDNLIITFNYLIISIEAKINS